MFDSPWRSRATAAQTLGAIPPPSTTPPAPRILFFLYLITSFTSFSLNALGRRVPDELVQLQTQPHRQTVSQNPFHEHARLEARPLPLWIFEHRRKQYLFHPLRQAVLQRQVARKFIIAPRGKHELHFIVFGQPLEIPHLERIRLARIGTLHVHNLDYFSRQPS